MSKFNRTFRLAVECLEERAMMSGQTRGDVNDMYIFQSPSMSDDVVVDYSAASTDQNAAASDDIVFRYTFGAGN